MNAARRLLVLVVVAGVFFASQELGHAAQAYPAGLAGYLRALVGIIVAGILLLALAAHREARR